MQPSEIISVNLWQILISLANLLIIFLILKKFLFKPIKAAMDKRQAMVDEQFAAAKAAEEKAMQDKADWEQKMACAEAQADSIIKQADTTAREHGDRLVAEAKDKAAGILRQAETDAALEHKKAEQAMRVEIVEISTQLAEKMLEREIKANDHQGLIDSFLEDIGHE